MVKDTYSQIKEFSRTTPTELLNTINSWAKENTKIITSMVINRIEQGVDTYYEAYVIYNEKALIREDKTL